MGIPGPSKLPDKTAANAHKKAHVITVCKCFLAIMFQTSFPKVLSDRGLANSSSGKAFVDTQSSLKQLNEEYSSHPT